MGTRKPPVSDLLNALRTEFLEALAGAELRIVARAREAVAPVPLARQLLSQAPPNAAGYRLVLPPDSAGGKPRYAPRKTAAGTAPCWTVRQLQLPDDDRLREGEVYRIVWLDAQGCRIPPTPADGVPGLRFFLARATLSDDPVDQQYEQALVAATGQPSEARVRQQVTERHLRRAHDLEQQAALARRAEREAEELRRTAAHLAETRQQAAELAEVQRRAKELAAVQVAAQHPSWQLWLPVALSFLPTLMQGGLLLWERSQTASDPKGEKNEAARSKLRGAFNEALMQISGALDKLSPSSARQAGPQLQAVPATNTSALPAAAVETAARDTKVLTLSPQTASSAPVVGPSSVQALPGLRELEQKQARLAQVKLEVASLAKAPDSVEKLDRLRRLYVELGQLVQQTYALTSQVSLPPGGGEPPIKT